MFEIIALIFLIIIVAVETVIIYRKMKQAEKYQEVVDLYESWIENFAITVETIDNELDKIDAEGTFRSDDEVGFFFQAIYSILKRLSDFGLVDPPEQIPGGVTEETDVEFYARNRELVKRIQKRRQNIELEELIKDKNVVKRELEKQKVKEKVTAN